MIASVDFYLVKSGLSGVNELTKEQQVKLLIKLLQENGIEIEDYRIIYWCYIGDESCENNSWEMWREKLIELSNYLNNNYEIFELQEQDEGDSILLVVRPDQITKLVEYLNASLLFF